VTSGGRSEHMKPPTIRKGGLKPSVATSRGTICPRYLPVRCVRLRQPRASGAVLCCVVATGVGAGCGGVDAAGFSER
jgi:hypothetical protein